MTRPPAHPDTPGGLFCAAEHHITGALCHRLAALCDGLHTADGEPPWFNQEEDDR